MNTAEYYPYRTAAARDLCFRYLDGLAARLWPIVSEERMVPTTFGATFVRVSGPPAAPAIVLLHGAGTTSLMWAPNIEALSREYRTVAVDQIGEFGKSVCAKPIRTLQDLIAWLDELIGALAVGARVGLVGMSYGGALAAQYALHFPERLEKVVLLAPGATVLRPPAEFWVRLIGLGIARQKGLRAFFRWVFADMARTDPQWVESTIEQLSLNMRSIQRHKPPIPPVLTDTEWRSLRTPTLFLAGENEVIYSAEKAVRRLKRAAPQVTAEIIPGAGHDLTFVQTATVNERILGFLKTPVERCGCRRLAVRRSIQLGRVQETALVPLYARALESRRKRPILQDAKAVEIVDSIDWDFRRFGQRRRVAGCCLRSAMFDVWVRDFLRRHPEGTVVEIGAGLNTRFERLDNGRVHWYDLELPDMVELRRRFFFDSERRMTLAGSVLNPDWIETVRRSPPPYLLVAETVFVYLEEGQVKAALGQIASGFPEVTIALDTVGRRAVDIGNRDFARRKMAARFQWACEDPIAIQHWNTGLRLMESRTMADVPDCLWPRLSLPLRANLRLFGTLFPKQMKVYQLCVFALEKGAPALAN